MIKKFQQCVGVLDNMINKKGTALIAVPFFYVVVNSLGLYLLVVIASFRF